MDELVIQSTIDGSHEPFLFRPATGTAPRPLLVGLHTWSADRFNQVKNFEPIAQAQNWHLALPEFRGPNLVKNPRAKEACASRLAKQDVIDTVDYVRQRYAVSDIYLMGGSGGGHMSLMLAAYRPKLWTAVSSWCPITDLAAWHRQNPGYAAGIAACCGGEPGDSAEVDMQYIERSPIHQLKDLSQATVYIHHGKHDRSVPYTHTLGLYNKLLGDFPSADIYCEILDGGHDFYPARGVEWFLKRGSAVKSGGTELTK